MGRQVDKQAEVETISAERLCALTNLSERRHRQMAEQGFFPPPIESRYQLDATISGIIRFYRDASVRAKGTLNDEKLGKTAAERRMAELHLKRALREVIPAKSVERAWSYLLQGIRARWLQLPARAVLAFSLWKDGRACETWLEGEVESILADLAENPDYAVADEPEDDEEAAQKPDDAAA